MKMSLQSKYKQYQREQRLMRIREEKNSLKAKWGLSNQDLGSLFRKVAYYVFRTIVCKRVMHVCERVVYL